MVIKLMSRAVTYGLDCNQTCSNTKTICSLRKTLNLFIPHAFCFSNSSYSQNHISIKSSLSNRKSSLLRSEFYGSTTDLGTHSEIKHFYGLRKISSSPIIAMGRRSSKIATRKTAQDAKKMKLYGKIGKQIVSALRRGGPSPESNSELALALAQAKLYDIPKDIVERNMKKASEKGQGDFTEITYEVYGLGGVGIVLEVLTDNNTRTAQFVRDIVKKGGGKMGDPGSVMFNFKRQGVVAVKCEDDKLDDLMMASMDAGADDFIEPSSSMDLEEEEEEEDASMAKVICGIENFSQLRLKLQELNFSLINDYTGLQLIPLNYIQVDEEAREMNQSLMDKLLELDDVDAVYSNQK